MEEKATLIGSLFEKTEDYAKSSIELLKLKAVDKSTNALSSVASVCIILVSTMCIISMVNIGIALWISMLMDNSYSGFFIVALFYAVLSVVLYVFREQIIKAPVSNRIITHIRKEIHI
ncbi:MAG: phage holin family protein [Chitinophagaceae bacterium]